MTGDQPIKYAELVYYKVMDLFKVDATATATTIAANLGRYDYAEPLTSRGESSYVWDKGDKFK